MKPVAVTLSANATTYTAGVQQAQAANAALNNSLTQVTVGLNAQTNALNQVSTGAKKAAGDVSAFRQKLEELKEGAGRGSTLDEFAKTLRGAGAVAGIALIGEELSKLTGKIAEANAEYRKGQTDAAGIAVKIGEGLPIIGGFVTAGQNIREMFTHQKEQVDDVTAATKRQKEAAETLYKVHTEGLAEIKRLRREADAANDATAGIGLTGINAKHQQIEVEYKTKTQDLTDKVAEDIKKANDQVKAETEKLYEALSDLRQRRGRSSDGSDVAKELDRNIAETQGQIQSLQAEAAKTAAGITAAGAATRAAIDNNRQAQIAAANSEYQRQAKELGDALRFGTSQQGIDLRVQGLKDEDIKKVKELQDAHLDPASFVAAATETNKLAEQSKLVSDHIEQIKKTMKEVVDADGLRQFSAQNGDYLKKAGLDREQYKDVFKLQKDGGSTDQINQLVDSLAGANKAKGLDALDDLRAKVQAVQAAVRQGIDPKLAEEMQKLHLDPAASQEFRDLSESLKKLDEAAKVKDRIKDLRDELGALKAGVSKEDFDLLGNSAVSDSDKALVASLERQKKALEETKRLLDESRSPYDKYREEVDQLNQLLAQGAVTKDQYDRAMAKAGQEVQKAEDPREQQKVVTEERRFGFDVQTQGHDDLLKVNQDSLGESKKQTNYQNQLWQLFQNGKSTLVNLDNLN